jgi:HEAT repeat protein
MYAAGALVNIANRDDESVVEALVAAATKDKDAYVRKYAGDALAQLNPEAAAQAGVTNSPAGK